MLKKTRSDRGITRVPASQVLWSQSLYFPIKGDPNNEKKQFDASRIDGRFGRFCSGSRASGDYQQTAQGPNSPRPAGGPIIDTHIHIWKLPRSLPPMSDFGTYPGDPTDGFCCTINASNPSGAVPWLQQDALIPDYQANWGGRRVNQVVVIESSVGVTPANIMQSNLWMLQVAANDTNGPDGGSKILSVVGALDTTESTTTFQQQLMQLVKNPLFVGIRLGDLGSIFNAGCAQHLCQSQAKCTAKS